jgi:hypothetical protein
MNNQILRARQLAAYLAAATLTACGGSSDGPTVPSLTQYAGLWKSPCMTLNNRQSAQTWLDVRANSTTDTRLNGMRISVAFTNPGCTGDGSSQRGYFVDGTSSGGTRSTPSGEANMVMLQFNASNPNDEPAPDDYGDLMLIQDGRLYLGDRNQISPDGYPADLDLSTPWTR